MKTSELTGAALDWAVAKCEAEAVELISTRMIVERLLINLTPKQVASLPAPKPYLVIPGVGNAAYSTNWSQGGPIIERESMGIWMYQWNEQGEAEQGWYAEDKDGDHVQTGPTPLIAAMRVYVASKLGDDVEVPDELHRP